MKFVSFEVDGRLSYGIIKEDGVVDLGRRLGSRYPSLKSLITAGFPAEAAAAAREAG